MLLCDVLDPFSLADIRARPKRHLIVFPTKMDKRNRKAFPFNFDGEIGNVRCTLGERILLRQRVDVAVSMLSYSVVGIVIVGGYKEELQWYRLQRIYMSQSVVIIGPAHLPDDRLCTVRAWFSASP